jgi:hypothetical protein
MVQPSAHADELLFTEVSPTDVIVTLDGVQFPNNNNGAPLTQTLGDGQVCHYSQFMAFSSGRLYYVPERIHRSGNDLGKDEQPNLREHGRLS